MKDLQNFINESNSVEELRKDYEDASYVTGKEKKDLVAKYNVGSNKAKDIKYAILVKLQELRKNKDSFDKDDICDFSQMSESDTQYYEELKKENDAFVKFLLDDFEKRLKSKGDLFKWVNLTSFSGLSFSSAEKWLIKHYQKIREELISRDPKNIAAKEKEEYNIDTLVTKLSDELEDFKKEYLKRVEESANKAYDNLPSEIEKLYKTLETLKKEYEEKKLNLKGYTARWYAQEPIRKQENKIDKKKAILRIYKTKSSFVKTCLEDAEKTFKSNVDALAHRVYEKKFDVDKIKVSNVKDDPKIFQLLIEDGTKKLYCRSILAAQFSDKMVPHFRFIMTDRK